MPHLTLEYSSNLRDTQRFDVLCRQLAHVLGAQRNDAGQAVYPIGGIRVRALACDAYCIADGQDAEAAFVHASLKIGAGRSATVLQATGDALFAILKTYFEADYSARGLALSLDIGEFSEAGTWKHNNLHAKFRSKAA